MSFQIFTIDIFSFHSYLVFFNFSDQNFTDESKNLKNCERYSAKKVAEFSYPIVQLALYRRNIKIGIQ